MGQVTLQDIYDRLFASVPTVSTSMEEAQEVIRMVADYLGWPCFDSDEGEESFLMQFKQVQS